MTSWIDDCNKYVAEKSNLSPAIAEAPLVKRICRSYGTRFQNLRGYNIISAMAQDSKDEDSYRTRNIQQGEKSYSKAVNKYFSNTRHGYDIISMEGKYGTNKEEVDKRKGNMEPRGFCVSGHPSTAQYAIYAESYIDNPPTPKTKRKQEARREKWKTERRNFNLINNQYEENHEEKVQMDKEMERDRISNATLKSNTYNPLTRKYIYEEDEEAAQKTQQLKEEKICSDFKNHTYKVSNIVGQSEGHAYDIINARVYNPKCLLAAERKHMKGLPLRADLRRQWEQQRDVDEVINDVIQQRSCNRTNQIRRLHETIDRGHDIISNLPFKSDMCIDENALFPHVPPSVEALGQNPLKPVTVAEKLSWLQKTKPMVETTLARTDGPRTTQERVFLVPSSEISLNCSTNESRRKRLQPVLATNNAIMKLNPSTSSSVVGSKVAKSMKSDEASHLQLLPLRNLHSGVRTAETGGIKAFY
eukprot:Tbor_TRINITY_DN5559_c2_g3::TRINITY_DN5559_c2_g3_i1::g.13201::m.13201